MSVRELERTFETLPIASIDAPAMPSRSEMRDELLDELADSIRAVGLVNAISVARVGDRFEVVAGHRRRIASERAGLAFVPCFVYPSRAAALDAIQFAENRHREELSAADEAIWFAELLEHKCDGDIEKLCGLVGEKRSYVDNRLLLIHGDPLVFQALQRGDIKIGVAHELNKFPAGRYREHYLSCAIRGGATQGLVIGWLTEFRNMFGEQPPQPAPADASPAGMPDHSGSPFVCVICGKNDNVHLIRQIDIHQHCKMAILDPLLANARGDA